MTLEQASTGTERTALTEIQKAWKKLEQAYTVDELIRLSRQSGSKAVRSKGTNKEVSKAWHALKHQVLIRAAVFRKDNKPILIGRTRIINDEGEAVRRIIFVFFGKKEGQYFTRARYDVLAKAIPENELQRLLNPLDDVKPYLPESMRAVTAAEPDEQRVVADTETRRRATAVMDQFVARLSVSQEFTGAAGLDFFNPPSGRSHCIYLKGDNRFSVFYRKNGDSAEILKIDTVKDEKSPLTLQRYLLETGKYAHMRFVADARVNEYLERTSTASLSEAFSGLSKIV